jgi:hypothetical protein
MGTTSASPVGYSLDGIVAIHRRRRHGPIPQPRPVNSRKQQFDMASHWSSFQSCHRLYLPLCRDICSYLVNSLPFHRSNKCSGVPPPGFMSVRSSLSDTVPRQTESAQRLTVLSSTNCIDSVWAFNFALAFFVPPLSRIFNGRHTL